MNAALEGGVLWPVARALIALIGVCLLAWVALLWLSRHGMPGSRVWARLASSPIGLGIGKESRLRLIERLSLGPRQRLYLVQADARVFLVGSGESGALALIAELTHTTQSNTGP